MIQGKPITVRGYHLDIYGHVNNARYLEFLEEARWQLLEEYFDLKFWEKHNLGFVAVNINIDFRRPATQNDVLVVHSNLQHLGGKSGVLRQKVVLQGKEHLVADAGVTFVLIELENGQPQPIAGDIRAAFSPILAQDSDATTTGKPSP